MQTKRNKWYRYELRGKSVVLLVEKQLVGDVFEEKVKAGTQHVELYTGVLSRWG